MPEARAQDSESGLSPTIRSVVRGVVIFIGMQFAISTFFGADKAGKSINGSSVPSAVPSFGDRPTLLDSEATRNAIPQNIAPIWPPGTAMDISIYISPSLIMPKLSSVPQESLVVDEKGYKIRDWKDNRQIDTSFAVPEEVQANATLWSHYYVAVSGETLDPLEKSYDATKAYHFVRPLTHYLPKRKTTKAKWLLGGSNATETPNEISKSEGPLVASYYHPNISISVIPDSGTFNFPNMHPALRQYLYLESTGARDASGQNGWYYPILYVDTFWQLREDMIELNSSVKTLPLHINLNNYNWWKFSIFASIDEGMKRNQRKIASGGPIPAAGDGSELEEFKRILIGTNVYLLAITGIVSVLHMIFETLAFKSDISHWRNKKDNVGVSVRTILANVFMQLIIFLYLVDNKEGTSWMILAGQGFGILLEAWKITKTVDVRVRPAPANSLVPYRVTFEDKHKLSDTELKTKEYDEIAFKYLYVVAVPLLVAYAAYSLVYETHKSWYSFVIATLVGSVYAYGFLMMVPSLYINYRLKSVAHLPRKAMTYKFLNTFIDDLFAWTIKMPTLHRLATLRDDLIFFVYLYQSYKYKVDHTRVNEFGQGGEDEKEDIQAKLASKPLTPPTDSVDATASASDAAGAVVASGREDGQGGGGAKGVRTREGGRTKR